ncbi:hypothetical protein KU306_00365 [Haloferax larsenii]|uniref:Major facilitator superfamily (MFS) profile domain-containing protein n=2 Tax=Haloferax TaxID=2251 RepID=A0ABY5RFP9_HALLR|nr:MULTISPECIES: hypothetical protein [Haloferax]ELZ82437.1 hypothetical protein C453_15168 [Haloferax elongans ATCC BAA-1513]UVE50400.1 hypothetical protein KU306_00365 [Haloferax larsenii]
MVVESLTAVPLQLGGLLGSQLGQLLLVLVAIAVVILVGRLVLKIAWRLVTIAAVIIGALLLLSFFGLSPF